MGIAYTKLPRDAAEADSGVVVVRKTRRAVRLLVSCRWMFVPIARGSGNATSIGFVDAIPSGRDALMLDSDSIAV